MSACTVQCSAARESREANRGEPRLSRGGLRIAPETQEATP